MKSYYIRFGRRHPLPSTLEILDELRHACVPGYVRKSWAQDGFRRPVVAGGDGKRSGVANDRSGGMAPIQSHASPNVFPPF